MEVPAGKRGRAAPLAAEDQVEALFYANDEACGYRRMRRVLVRGGVRANSVLATQPYLRAGRLQRIISSNATEILMKLAIIVEYFLKCIDGSMGRLM